MDSYMTFMTLWREFNLLKEETARLEENINDILGNVYLDASACLTMLTWGRIEDARNILGSMIEYAGTEEE